MSILSQNQSASFNDMMLLHEIIKATEDDENLSSLPDDFKKIAIETMFDEAKTRQCVEENNDDYETNKRLRVEGAPMEE